MNRLLNLHLQNSVCLAISCVQNDQYVSTEDNLLLSEVSICMDRNFTVIDCYNQKTYGGCSPDKPINTYPVTPHSQSSGNIGGSLKMLQKFIYFSQRLSKCYFRDDFWSYRCNSATNWSCNLLILVLS